MKPGYVYILTNKPGGTLYIGVTDDLARRVMQHRSGAVSSFAKKYNCHQLVWFESLENIHDARQFEARMKKWKRDWKVARIKERNPGWSDLVDRLPGWDLHLPEAPACAGAHDLDAPRGAKLDMTHG